LVNIHIPKVYVHLQYNILLASQGVDALIAPVQQLQSVSTSYKIKGLEVKTQKSKSLITKRILSKNNQRHTHDVISTFVS